MKVKELKEKLENCNPEDETVVPDCHSGGDIAVVDGYHSINLVEKVNMVPTDKEGNTVLSWVDYIENPNGRKFSGVVKLEG